MFGAASAPNTFDSADEDTNAMYEKMKMKRRLNTLTDGLQVSSGGTTTQERFLAMQKLNGNPGLSQEEQKLALD